MLRPCVILLALLFGTAAVAAELGDDGLHKAPWMRDTFEDLAEASGEGKRLLLFERRGCIYCTRMHEEVFPDPDVARTITDSYFVVQLNLHRDTEVVDFDGETLSEKAIARRWGILLGLLSVTEQRRAASLRSVSRAAGVGRTERSSPCSSARSLTASRTPGSATGQAANSGVCPGAGE